MNDRTNSEATTRNDLGQTPAEQGIREARKQASEARDIEHATETALRESLEAISQIEDSYEYDETASETIEDAIVRAESALSPKNPMNTNHRNALNTALATLRVIRELHRAGRRSIAEEDRVLVFDAIGNASEIVEGERDEVDFEIAIGDRVRSYDSPETRDDPTRTSYVEGVVTGFQHVEGCLRYQIHVDKDVSPDSVSTKIETGSRVGCDVHPPVNGIPTSLGRTTSGVELIEDEPTDDPGTGGSPVGSEDEGPDLSTRESRVGFVDALMAVNSELEKADTVDADPIEEAKKALGLVVALNNLRHTHPDVQIPQLDENGEKTGEFCIVDLDPQAKKQVEEALRGLSDLPVPPIPADPESVFVDPPVGPLDGRPEAKMAKKRATAITLGIDETPPVGRGSNLTREEKAGLQTVVDFFGDASGLPFDRKLNQRIENDYLDLGTILEDTVGEVSPEDILGGFARARVTLTLIGKNRRFRGVDQDLIVRRDDAESFLTEALRPEEGSEEWRDEMEHIDRTAFGHDGSSPERAIPEHY